MHPARVVGIEEFIMNRRRFLRSSLALTAGGVLVPSLAAMPVSGRAGIGGGEPIIRTVAFEPSFKTVNAASPSRAHVQAAIDLAKPGDTVLVPAGTATWSERVTLAKDITLKGAGAGKTVITTNVSSATIELESASRITDFSFLMADGLQCIRTTGRGWRIDHCYFESIRPGSVKVLIFLAQNTGAHPYGLMDNCHCVHPRILVTGPYGIQNTWPEPTNLGTIHTVVIEDCVFRDNVTSNMMDANYGGHFVVRHCTIYDGQIQCHGVAANLRATRKWEIYNNTWIQKQVRMWTPMFLRAGTGVIYNNSLQGTWSNPRITFDTRRGYHPHGAGGLADGNSWWDGNEPITINGTGRHTGSSSAILIDSTKQWGDELLPIEVSRLALQTYRKWVYNLTSGAKGPITRHTGTTATAQLTGGTRQSWQTGDKYKITGGYASRDQIGRGQDAFPWGNMTGSVLQEPSIPAPPQALEPVYIWNQTGGFQGAYVHNGEQNAFLIQEGRDYIFGKHPNYKPLQYPHPFRSASANELAPPKHLRIATT
jgi:hypothetical protein